MAQEFVTKLELKPFVPTDGQKCKVIQITDFLVHTTKHPPTKSVGRKVAKAVRSNEPGRVYSPITGDLNQDLTEFVKRLHEDPSFIAYVQEEQAKGYKVLLQVPKTGVPLNFGKDTKQFLESKRGKRVLRGLAKKTDD